MDSEAGGADQPVRKRGRPRQSFTLKSLWDLRDEMVRVYRDMRNGKVDVGDGYRMVSALNIVADVTEKAQGAGLVARLDELEARRVSTSDSGANPPTN